MSLGTIPQSIKKKYDCVVIGAGNGGLAAAARLAVTGARVLLLEQHNLPGGFASSFVRGRFEFETALHQLADIGWPTAKGDVRKFLEDEVGVHLDWVEIPEAFRYILTDPQDPMDVTLPYGQQELIDTIEKAVPGSREAITRYMALCKDIFEGLTFVGRSRGNPNKMQLLTEHGNFLKTAPYTMDDIARTLNLPEHARRLIQAQWSYIGPQPKRTSFTIFGGMLYKFVTRSAWIPRQRSHELSLALAERIREMGGDIQYNTRATGVQVKAGRIVGVTTSQGDNIETQHVISNASPTLVYHQLITPKSETPEIALREGHARIYGLGGMVVYMGLDAPISELGLNEYSYMIFSTADDEAIYRSFNTLDAPKTQAGLCMNTALPDCSPPGTSIVTLTTLFRPEAWHNVAPKDYVRVKNRIASSLINDFEKATGSAIRKHIEEFEVATPQTFARYTGSYDGGIYGYEPEPWDSLLPRMMMMNEDQHVKGLRFCGGYAFRCTGYSSSLLSGQTAALLTLRDIKEGE